MTRKRSSLTTPCPGVMGQASIDSVLEYAGVSHPAVTTQLLACLGLLILSMGSLVTGPLLPIPLYSCWGAMGHQDYPRSSSCTGHKLLPSPPLQSNLHIWQCRTKAPWFSIFSIMAALLVVVRIIFSILTGLFLDVHGRRRVCIVSMGVYFIFALARTFAPNVEVAIIAVVIEGSAVQAATFGLVLIAIENSTQKECMRSVCLILIGHSIAVGALSTTVDVFLESHTWVQLAKSLPSIAFVTLICFLPESVRWVLTKGDWVDATFLFPKTHNIILDESIKPKLIAVQQESQRCLSLVRCRGSSIRRSVCPLFRCATLARVFFIFFVLSLVYGFIVGVRMILDPSPYISLADRSLAHGLTELMVLIFMGLVLGRTTARPLISLTFISLAAALCLSTLFDTIGVATCTGEIIFSLLGHACTISVGISLIVSMARLCPTHSRGMLIGICWGLATAGYACAASLFEAVDKSHYVIERYSLRIYISAGVCVLAGLLGLLLPATPSVLPDSLSHISQRFNRDDRNSEPFHNSTTLENTKF